VNVDQLCKIGDYDRASEAITAISKECLRWYSHQGQGEMPMEVKRKMMTVKGPKRSAIKWRMLRVLSERRVVDPPKPRAHLDQD
jgi:hypothetical protein